MSFSSSDISLSSIGTDAGIPDLNVADIPENVRDGDNSAKEAYVEGLEFEKMLLTELTQQLSSSLSGSTGIDGGSNYSYGSGSNSSTDSTTTSYGSSGSSDSGFSSLISGALTDSIMDGGGLGIAEQIAASADPSINDAATSAASSTDTGTGDSTTGATAVGDVTETT